MDLWEHHAWLGKPVRVGDWEYQGQRLAVRLFKSDTLYGSGDYEDQPEHGEDRQIECYYAEFQVYGEERWGTIRAFLGHEEILKFNNEQLSGSLRWQDCESEGTPT
jgi:hypothetical protein